MICLLSAGGPDGCDMRESKKIRKASLEYRAKKIGTAALLLCVSLASEALTLGNLRGPAVIGRPLDVAIPIQVEQTDNAAASCFEAEVFYADVRQAAARVRVSVEPTGVAQSNLVRVKSSALVNEPVVSVTLRTRCDIQTERRYVLLADLPPAVDLTSPIQTGGVSDASPPTSSSSSSSNLPPAAASLATLPATTETPLVKPARAVRPKPVATVNRPLKSASKATDPTSRPVPAPSGQSRLQLDNLELFSDRIALLDQAQPDAAVDYVSPDQQKVKDLQGTIQSLQAAAAKNDANLKEMTARFQQSETERFPAWLVVVLAGLVLAAIAAIAVLWGRQRRAHAQEGDWWGESVVTPESTAVPLTGAFKAVPLAPAPPLKPEVEPPLEHVRTFRPSRQWPDSKNDGVDVNEVEMGESRFNHYLQSGEVNGGATARSGAVPAPLAMPHWESQDAGLIAELRQQADFFVALGQTDQAVIVLEQLIQDSEVPNPNVFLDLLGLLHSLSKKVEFLQYRDEFNRIFNVLAPEFVRFRSEGRSLEDYPATLADVIAHWTTLDALDCINAHVVRPPHQLPGGALDLAAFRDMLLLQAIAQQLKTQEMAPGQDLSAGQGSRSSAIAPLSMDQEEPGLVSMMALDLDLSDDAALPHPRTDGLRGSSEAPVTFPTELNANHPATSPKDNLIDFDLSEDVQPLNPNRKL